MLVTIFHLLKTGKDKCRRPAKIIVVQYLPSEVGSSYVDIWLQDETRVGQQGSLTRILVPKGTRPRKVKQQQFISTYIYGSACAATGEAFGLVLPYTNTATMELYFK